MSLRILLAVFLAKTGAVLFFAAALYASKRSHIPDVIEDHNR